MIAGRWINSIDEKLELKLKFIDTRRQIGSQKEIPDDLIKFKDIFAFSFILPEITFTNV